jgi:hypothetical protein
MKMGCTCSKNGKKAGRSWEDNVKTDLKVTGDKGESWIELPQDRGVQPWYHNCDEHSFSDTRILAHREN